MEPQDRRVQRTQTSLAKALIELTLEKGYQAITIQDITERAGVGYATFFRHYTGKEALLKDVLEVVLTELTTLLPSTTESDPAQVGTAIFEYVAAHSEVIRVLLSSGSSSDLLRRVIEVGSQGVLSDNQPQPAALIPAEVAAFHLVNSTIGLLQWWLEQGQPYSTAEMGQVYARLIVGPVTALAFARPLSPLLAED